MRPPPESLRAAPRDPAFVRSVGDVVAPEWHRRRDRAAIIDRARGFAHKARRHDEGQHDRAASTLTRAEHLVAMEVAWVDCLVWTLRALVTVALLITEAA